MPERRFCLHERQRLRVGDRLAGAQGAIETFEPQDLERLARFVEAGQSKAFTLGYRSVTLGHHVGLLRLGPLQLEIWPKLAAHDAGEDRRPWRALLLTMLREVWDVRLTAVGTASLDRWTGDLFDLLVARFLDCTEALLREGLARSYREVQDNSPVFRGRLLVSEQVRHNAADASRCFVAHEVLDADNLPNRVLFAAVEAVRRLRARAGLVYRAEDLSGRFPEAATRPLQPTELTALRLDRRTARYREALALARLILTASRPDLRWGDGEVLCLLFDMEHLFEAWVAARLRRVPGLSVSTQARYPFWEGGARSVGLKPDLVLRRAGVAEAVVVDTKWAVPRDGRPSDEHLRQLFAYLHRVGARRGVLLYPRAFAAQEAVRGRFVEQDGRRCDLEYLDLFSPGEAGALEVVTGTAGLAALSP